MDIKRIEERLLKYLLTKGYHIRQWEDGSARTDPYPEIITNIVKEIIKPAINKAYEVSARIALDNLADDKWATCSGIAKLIREEKIK